MSLIPKTFRAYSRFMKEKAGNRGNKPHFNPHYRIQQNMHPQTAKVRAARNNMLIQRQLTNFNRTQHIAGLSSNQKPLEKHPNVTTPVEENENESESTISNLKSKFLKLSMSKRRIRNAV